MIKFFYLRMTAILFQKMIFFTLIESVKEKVPYMDSPEVREFVKKYVPEYNYSV